MDAIIYKLSSNGVPEAVYAADTMPSDGITDGRGENGNWGGYNHLQSLANFELAGDSSSIVAAGWFRGNLTCPMGAAGGTTILTNREESMNYDAFVIKINGATMQGEWAVGVGQALGREQGSAVRTTSSGDVLVLALGYSCTTYRCHCSRHASQSGASLSSCGWHSVPSW